MQHTAPFCALVAALGTLHCSTKQEPLPVGMDDFGTMPAAEISDGEAPAGAPLGQVTGGEDTPPLSLAGLKRARSRAVMPRAPRLAPPEVRRVAWQRHSRPATTRQRWSTTGKSASTWCTCPRATTATPACPSCSTCTA